MVSIDLRKTILKIIPKDTKSRIRKMASEVETVPTSDVIFLIDLFGFLSLWL